MIEMNASYQASPVRVFISYSHDNREHCDQVLAFAQQLRLDGIDAELDQFHQDELVHWPRWCEEKLRPEKSQIRALRLHCRIQTPRGPELLRLRGSLACDHASDHPDPVATTWALSFQNIEKANPAAAELLRFCAFLHPEIPEEVFSEGGAAELGPVLGALATDALALDSAISEILKYSPLRRDANARTFEIHRLVQAVLKHGMDHDAKLLWAERAVRAINHAFPGVEISTWAVCERLLNQAYTCAELIKQCGFAFPQAALLLNATGVYLLERARYTDAEPLFERALAIREKALGAEHPDVAAALNNLAALYRDQGQYAEAEPLFERALAIKEKALGAEHPNVAMSLNGLALLYDNKAYTRRRSSSMSERWRL